MEASSHWQVSGDAAERYEANLVPVVFVPWAKDLLARAKLRPGEGVLDVACGTGIVARMATVHVGPGGRVTGADLNPGTLKVARARAVGTGAAIEWREADAGDLPFAGRSFDTVFCQQGLQFFRDRPRGRWPSSAAS